jgi:multidrug resistance efflux pump
LGSKSAAQWKAEIANQRNTVTSLQNQIQKVNASIRFAPGTCVRNCVQYNERQIDKQDQVQRMQEQLEEAKKKLDDLQEGARREGFGNAVWEP